MKGSRDACASGENHDQQPLVLAFSGKERHLPRSAWNSPRRRGSLVPLPVGAMLVLVSIALGMLLLASSGVVPLDREPVTNRGGISTTQVPAHAQQAQEAPAPGTTTWMQEMLTGVGTGIAQGFGTLLTNILDWATAYGFLYVTPKSLTYGHEVVIFLHRWMVGLLDGVLTLILVIGGYAYMSGRFQDLRELLLKVFFAAVAANFSLYFIEQFIELHNALSLGVQGALATAGVGDLTLPQNITNWMYLPFYAILTYVVNLLMAVLLVLQMLVRIALLNVLIIVAPLGLMCLAIPQTAAWGRLWVQAFVCTLIVQFLQVLCIGMGSAFIGWIPVAAIASFGQDVRVVITLLIGIASSWLAFQLPGMLLSNALRASVGHAKVDVLQTVVALQALRRA